MGANAAGWYQDTPCLFSTLSLCFGRHYQWKYFLADTGNPLYVTIVWHTPFISMLNIQTLRSSTCADFHVFLLFSVSLFFSLLTSSFLSLLRSDPYTKTLQVFDLTPYLVQSPRCIWIDGLLTSVRELSLFQACWKDPVTRLGYRAIQHVFDKRMFEHSKFIRHYMEILLSPPNLSFQDSYSHVAPSRLSDLFSAPAPALFTRGLSIICRPRVLFVF